MKSHRAKARQKKDLKRVKSYGCGDASTRFAPDERAGRILAYCSRTGHVGEVKEQGGRALGC